MKLVPGEDVQVRRTKQGYTVSNDDGKVFLRRVTSLNALPKDWMGRWAANKAAIRAIENFPEIVTILGGHTPEELEAAAEALEEKRWRSVPATAKAAYQDVKEAPWQKRDDAGDFGNAVHYTLEALIKGDPLPDNLQHEEEVQCAVNAETLYRDLMDGGEIIHSEVSVVNPDVMVPYAGTFDLYGRVRTGDRWLLDWKTAAKGPFVDWVTQQVAYRNAPYALVNGRDHSKPGKQTEVWTATVAEWGPDHVDRLGIVHVRPEFARLIEILPACWKRAWIVFRAASCVYTWSKDTDSYRSAPRVKCYSDPLMEVLP